MKLTEIRRQRLRFLMEKHGPKNLSVMLGYAQPSFLSTLGGPNPTREITERTARTYEKKLDLPDGWIDEPIATAPSSENFATESVTTMRTVVALCQEEGIDLPMVKLVELVALVVEDTIDHCGELRVAYVKRLLNLLK